MQIYSTNDPESTVFTLVEELECENQLKVVLRVYVRVCVCARAHTCVY